MPEEEKKSSTIFENQPSSVSRREVLLSWQAPSRLFKRRGKEFWSTAFSLLFLLTVIMFFIQEWFLIVVMFALVFVFYVSTSFPPEEITYEISNRGLKVAEKEYFWEEFSQFWISQKWEQKILNLETNLKFPGRIPVLIKSEDEAKIREILDKYLPEETPTPTFLDKSSEWLTKKVPLEN